MPLVRRPIVRNLTARARLHLGLRTTIQQPTGQKIMSNRKPTPAPVAAAVTQAPSSSSWVGRLAALAARRVYQYELTFGLYMLGPVEKSIFNAFVVVFAVFFMYAVAHIPEYAGYAIARGRYYLTAESA
ncbi:hypothetical protein HK405_001172 [Cladochytrium tenue]|nr:hypothetical protein HK405_001172 [Cladochytrium tenue]